MAAPPFEVGQAIEVAPGGDVERGGAQVCQGFLAVAALRGEEPPVEKDFRIAREGGGEAVEDGLGLLVAPLLEGGPELAGERARIAGSERRGLLGESPGGLQVAPLAGRGEEREGDVGCGELGGEKAWRPADDLLDPRELGLRRGLLAIQPLPEGEVGGIVSILDLDGGGAWAGRMLRVGPAQMGDDGIGEIA